MRSKLSNLLLVIFLSYFAGPGEPVIQEPVTRYRLFTNEMVNLTSTQDLGVSKKEALARCGTLCIVISKECFGYEYTKMETINPSRSPGSCRLIRGNGLPNVTAFQRSSAAGTDLY
jgi:hypothetical protein